MAAPLVPKPYLMVVEVDGNRREIPVVAYDSFEAWHCVNVQLTAEGKKNILAISFRPDEGELERRALTAAAQSQATKGKPS